MKKCEVCGKFMSARLHGACDSCLTSSKHLPPHLKKLFDAYDEGKFIGKEKHSVRGILNAASTLLLDGMWYAVKWDPLGNLRKVVDTSEDRLYLSPECVIELEEIIRRIDEEDSEARRA
jgi:hypothetical protein